MERRQPKKRGIGIAITLALIVVTITVIQFTPLKFIDFSFGGPTAINISIGGTQNNYNNKSAFEGTTVTPDTQNRSGAISSISQETLLVPFNRVTCFSGNSHGVKTLNSYKGKTRITVSGAGQAKGRQRSDAFYIFTDSANNPLVNPAHRDPNNGLIDAVLWIDNQPTDNFMKPIPAYRSDHKYAFTINAPGGQLVFSVADCDPRNNTGSFTIVIGAG